MGTQEPEPFASDESEWPASLLATEVADVTLPEHAAAKIASRAVVCAKVFDMFTYAEAARRVPREQGPLRLGGEKRLRVVGEGSQECWVDSRPASRRDAL